jgi:anti-sigma regulatory factor (Ser/Thr protein kinase)
MISPDPSSRTTSGRAPTGVPEVVAVDQVFDADGLYALRAAVAAHGNHLGAGSAELERLLIIASELATNAVRHGGGCGRLRLWRRDNRIYCEVSDHGPGLADPQAGSVPPDQMARGGRGLWICRQLSDVLLVESGPRGATLTAAVVISPRPPRGGESTAP